MARHRYWGQVPRYRRSGMQKREPRRRHVDEPCQKANYIKQTIGRSISPLTQPLNTSPEGLGYKAIDGHNYRKNDC